MKTREQIRELVIEAITDTNKLTEVVDRLCDLIIPNKKNLKLFKTEINTFLKNYNKIFKSNRRAVNETLLKARLQKFSHEEIKTAILRASKDTYHIEKGFIYLTPEYFVRNDVNIDKWLNLPEEKKEEKQKENNLQPRKDYKKWKKEQVMK